MSRPAPIAPDATAPADDAEVVTPSDDADLPGGVARSLVVDGAVRVTTARGNVVDLPDLGTYQWSLRVRRVHAGGTDAANIIALY